MTDKLVYIIYTIVTTMAMYFHENRTENIHDTERILMSVLRNINMLNSIKASI